MDAGRFDDVVRSLTNAQSGLEVLTELAAAVPGLAMLGVTSGRDRKSGNCVMPRSEASRQ